jgi:hypothetical protein
MVLSVVRLCLLQYQQNMGDFDQSADKKAPAGVP